jgi:hypothetical protein
LSPQIVALRGPLAGRSYSLAGASLSFGRAPENVVVIASPLASRRHAEVRFEAGAYLLYDLSSSNGTRVNGQPVSVHRLGAGDVFEIGDEAFRFELPAAYDQTLIAGAAQPGGPVAGPPAALPPLSPSPQPQQYQQPLPPLPTSPQASPHPAPAQAGPRRRGPGLPLIIGLLTVLGCVLVASLAGGALLLSRALAPGAQATAAAQPDSPTAGPAPTRAPVGAGAARWTVLVYLDGDNNLESDALDDLREMARVGSSDELKIVVQLDRIRSSEAWDDTSAGDWEGTRRFLVERDMEPTADAALEDMGEQNMGAQEVLADFVAWGVRSYPAERYALVIWDHGASWLGIASDDTDEDTLSLPELSAALATARERSGYGSLDLIGFDACLMAQLDVFQAVEPYGQVVVASAELEPNQGWAWDAWLGALAANPGQDAYAIAPVIVESYIASYAGTGADDVTLSAFDLTRVSALTEGLDTLTGAMIDDMATSYGAIAQARSFASVYAPTSAEEFNAVDLGHFLALLPEQGARGAVAEAAASLEQAVAQARIANGAGAYHSDTSGISIYFPQTEELYLDEYERGSPLPVQTRWDDFLASFYTAGETAVTKPTISGLQASDTAVSLERPVTLSGTLAGQDIANVFWFIGVANAARDTVDLISVDFFYPPGVEPGSGDVPSWEAGQYELSLEWDTTSWYMSNGSEEIEVLLGPTKYGTTAYGIEGVYTSQATGEQIDAGLIFSVSGEQGVLTRIWGFPKGDGAQEPQPYELVPSAGDSFTAYLRSYTDEGDRLRPGSVEGQTIRFGEVPFTTRRAPTLDGDYVMGFLVRDIAGNFSYDYVDVTVNNR